MWGVQENWQKVAKGWIENPKSNDVKGRLTEFMNDTLLCGNKADARKLKGQMQRNGIWEQAQQIARENDWRIDPDT